VRNSREMEELGVTMWTAALNPKPLEMVQRFFLDQSPQSDRIYLSVEDAVDDYLSRFGSSQSHDS